MQSNDRTEMIKKRNRHSEKENERNRGKHEFNMPLLAQNIEIDSRDKVPVPFVLVLHSRRSVPGGECNVLSDKYKVLSGRCKALYYGCNILNIECRSFSTDIKYLAANEKYSAPNVLYSTTKAKRSATNTLCPAAEAE